MNSVYLAPLATIFEDVRVGVEKLNKCEGRFADYMLDNVRSRGSYKAYKLSNKLQIKIKIKAVVNKKEKADCEAGRYKKITDFFGKR